MMKKFLRFLPALAVMIIIFCFSAQNGERSSVSSNGVIAAAAGEEMTGIRSIEVMVRKSAHFLEFAALGAAVYFGARGVGTDKRQGGRLVISVLAGRLYAVTDELHKYFVPDRFCSARDVLIDTCGAAFGVMVMYLIFVIIGKLGQKR